MTSKVDMKGILMTISNFGTNIYWSSIMTPSKSILTALKMIKPINLYMNRVIDGMRANLILYLKVGWIECGLA